MGAGGFAQKQRVGIPLNKNEAVVGDAELCGTQNNFQHISGQTVQHQITEWKRKTAELHMKNRRYCTAAEASDVIHLGGDHRSVTAHFRTRRSRLV